MSRDWLHSCRVRSSFGRHSFRPPSFSPTFRPSVLPDLHRPTAACHVAIGTSHWLTSCVIIAKLITQSINQSFSCSGWIWTVKGQTNSQTPDRCITLTVTLNVVHSICFVIDREAVYFPKRLFLLKSLENFKKNAETGRIIIAVRSAGVGGDRKEWTASNWLTDWPMVQTTLAILHTWAGESMSSAHKDSSRVRAYAAGHCCG